MHGARRADEGRAQVHKGWDRDAGRDGGEGEGRRRGTSIQGRSGSGPPLQLLPQFKNSSQGEAIIQGLLKLFSGRVNPAF